MTLAFEEFVNSKDRFSHHALLLANRAFSHEGMEARYFARIAQAFCNLQLPPPNSETFWTDAQGNIDLFVADRERNILRLEDLSSIKDLARYPPTPGKRRLFFIDRCERMNANAANALLKVLEEPGTDVLFLLTTRSFSEVIATVASRCQKVSIIIKSENNKNIAHLFDLEDLDFFRSLFAKLNPKDPAPTAAAHGSSLISGELLSIASDTLSQCLEKAGMMAKKYSAEVIQDGLIFCLAETAANNPEFTPSVRFFLKDIREWKDAKLFNPSSQLWLAKIFIRAAVESELEPSGVRS